MGKVAKSWALLILPLAGVGLVFVHPAVGMGVALFGGVAVVLSVFSLNVPAARAAAVVGSLTAASAVYLASGSLLLAVSILPVLVLLLPYEVVLRTNRDASDYATAVGVLAGLVIAGLAWPTLTSPWWAAGPGVIFALGALLGLVSIKARNDYLTLLPKSKVRIGEPLPVDVSLPTRDGGAPFSLADHIGEFVLLVFIRGDWCPVCHVMLRIVSKERETLTRHGVRIAIISPTESQMDDEAVTRLGLDPGMLHDADSGLARSLDLLQRGKYEGKDVPMPVTILIDRDGKVRHMSKPDDVTAYSNERKVISILEASTAQAA